MKTQFDISRDALVMRISIGRYTGKRKSQELSKEAAQAHGADQDSIDSILHMFKREDTRPIRQIIGKARSRLLELTLPWDDNGMRLCPTARYLAIKKEMDGLQNEFIDAVEELISRYDDLKDDCKKRLNGLWDEHKFPSRDDMRGKFYWKLTEDRISKASDVKWSHIDGVQAQKIKEGIEDRIREQLESAQLNIIDRLRELVERVQHRLSAKSKAGEDSIFRNSLIENIREAVEILPDLNMLGNPKIDELIDKVKKELASQQPEEIRIDSKIRKQVVKSATSIMEELAAFKPAVD